VTGADGFVGNALLRRLAAGCAADDALIATDLAFTQTLPQARYLPGSIDDPQLVAQLIASRPDRIFHLATVAGVQSAADFALSKRINFDATLALLDAIRTSAVRPRFVYTSSIGVFGSQLPPTVDDDTLPVPSNSYGAHKLASELLIADYTRAGYVEGIALRLPGILARPEGSKTMLSAFLSEVWLMSRHTCLSNLIHAAEQPAQYMPSRRYWTLPALHVTMRELVAALADVFGPAVLKLIGYEPNARARAMFSVVPLRTPGAERLGFVGDRSPLELVRNACVDNAQLMPNRLAS
jgi:nucleoside-diphosphate-sugar epimerase